MPIEKSAQGQIEGLATLLVLNDETKKLSSLREFGFFSTNETHRLIPYHTAFLWKKTDFTQVEIIAQSGSPDVDIHSPLNLVLKELIQKVLTEIKANEMQQIDLDQIEFSQYIADDAGRGVFNEALPSHLLWCPFPNKQQKVTGGLVFFRESAFSDAEIRMLQWLISTYQYTWNVLRKPEFKYNFKTIKQKPLFIVAGILLVAILFFPIHLSVLATGTVVPKDPALISAPMEGVIKSFVVEPGSPVVAGQLLVTMDKADLESNVEVLEKEYLLTQAKLRTAINQSYDKKDSEPDIPILQSQLVIDKAKISYVRELLGKADIKSPIAGIVIFDSKEDWIGQPVKTGEQILLVADPKKVELKIMLPIANAIKIEPKSEGELFLYGQLRAIPIRVKTLGYNAKLTPNKTLSYQLSAEFVELKDIPQLGAQGTVRLYVHRVPLIYYLLRRPLEATRQTLGI
jgi:hypothetical protein